MGRQKAVALTKVEFEFMDVAWSAAEVTTDDIQARLSRRGRHLTGGSIRKILSILMRKGFLTRRQDGNTFYYRTVVPRDAARRGLVTDLLERAFGGSAGLMVAALLESQKVRREDVDEIKCLIARHEREGRP